MRPSALVERAALIVAAAVPAIAFDMPAHAAPWVTYEAGLGAGVSVVLGEAGDGGRLGGHVHAFWDSATKVVHTQAGQGTLSAGLVLGYRGTPFARRFEIKGRAGPAWGVQPQPGIGHVHFGAIRGEAGIAVGGWQDPALLLGGDARGMWGHGELVRYALGEPDATGTVLGIGLEMGLVPVIQDGRPLRDGGPARRPAVRIVGGSSSPEAERWLRSGQDELEAVASFQQLARELSAAGAPAGLIARCLAAADDEVVHAALCFGRAAEISGGRVIARPLRRRPRPRVSPARLAAESFWDGVVNEGRAAAEAASRGSNAEDRRDSEIHGRIARDEAGHAALGAAIVAWGSAERR